VHPDEDLLYIINMDASAKAIGAVSMQQDREGNRNIVCTASRVLTATEQRYTTCEQELLGIIFALKKFRLYIYGHKILLYADNKSLTFLNRCAITSNGVARWMLNLQQYDRVKACGYTNSAGRFRFRFRFRFRKSLRNVRR
jgi:hypothetical protein